MNQAFNRRVCLQQALATSVLMACLTVSSWAAETSYYVKKGTWQESLLASSESILKAGLKDGFEPFESETMRGGQSARQIQVNVAGSQEMYLFVTGCPDVKWGVADWAMARLIASDGKEISLSGSNRFKVLVGRHELNMTLRSGLYDPLRMGGREYKQGINVQAYSAIRVPLNGQYQRFEALIGVDDWAKTNGTVRFSVLGSLSAARKRLWESLERDFNDGIARQQMRWEQEDRIWEALWLSGNYSTLAQRYAQACFRVPPLAEQAVTKAASARDLDALNRVREVYYASRAADLAIAHARQFSIPKLRLAIGDLRDTFGAAYPNGASYLDELSQLEGELSSALGRLKSVEDYVRAEKLDAALLALQREALLANPLLDFDRTLVVKRKPMGDPRGSQWTDRGLGEYVGMPRQSSWGHGTMTGVNKWDNEIAVLSQLRREPGLRRLFKPDRSLLLSDIDLHFGGGKMLFSMPDAKNHWQIFEINNDGGDLRQLTPSDQPDIHNYDACYLPNGKIAFVSTAPLQGVPCNAGVIVGMIYLMDADGKNIQQVCFEQDHDYNPSVMNDGRILYLRWDYTDTPHVWNRILMSMNPDGTDQKEFYGSNSYWPNAVFFAHSIPGHPSKVVGIVTGHHEGRAGELVIFDPAKGRIETDGVVQRIPGYGQKVEPVIEDKLTEHSWPKFLYPYPLSERHFLVACKPGPDDLWGIYLVDTFDNRVLIKEEEGFALLEPIPFRSTTKPPVIVDRVQPERDDALVYMVNVYQGPGLKGVPRGTIKSLRVFTYYFGYQNMAGIDHRVGTDGPWEVKRVLGTVPVEADGSALFRVPAKMPISVQPLDAEGKAVALMRSWMTAMPGETLSCVGCHERQNVAPPKTRTLALAKGPAEIQPWHGPIRGFSFAREVQPVLDKYCVSCHDGQTGGKDKTLVDLRADQGKFIVYEHGKPALLTVAAKSKDQLIGKYAGVFEPSYIALRQYVRVGKLESDLHMLPPMEFHADTSELIQMLGKGHHGVQLDAEGWDRLVTWIDLNAPCQGGWREVYTIPIANQPERRQTLRQLYGGRVEDAESVIRVAYTADSPTAPTKLDLKIQTPPSIPQWPLSTKEAQKRQTALGASKRSVDLGGGVMLELTHIPAGTFIMGDPDGCEDESPTSPVEIKKAFWMGRFEVSNEQFARFDPTHDSRFEHRSSWIFSEEYLGWRLNHPRQPVVRVSWQQAMEFCRWLSNKLGEPVALPTEAQWEYACRAGVSTPMSYGGMDDNFSQQANMADYTLRDLAYQGWRPLAPDLVPRDDRFNDGTLVTADIGRYQSNIWGLHDMHGNAAEWTRSAYLPYPYKESVNREDTQPDGMKVVRGGSWRDRPQRCRSAFRLAYPSYQRIYNVGFRIMIEDTEATMMAGQ